MKNTETRESCVLLTNHQKIPTYFTVLCSSLLRVGREQVLLWLFAAVEARKDQISIMVVFP